jgi:hypothetical protein
MSTESSITRRVWTMRRVSRRRVTPHERGDKGWRVLRREPADRLVEAIGERLLD